MKKVKMPTNKKELNQLIEKAGSRRQTMLKLHLSPPTFYNLVHKLGLPINPTSPAMKAKISAGVKARIAERAADAKPAMAAATRKTKTTTKKKAKITKSKPTSARTRARISKKKVVTTITPE